MQAQELESLFDQQAGSYDRQWAKLAAINDALHLLVGAIFSTLGSDARILCVGSGTGSEILYLAQRFPGYRFTAVEPSTAMIEVCSRRAQEQGIAARCTFHRGYLDSLSATEPFDAATCFLVSQFILDQQERANFFRSIAQRLKPEGYLVTTDLASDTDSPSFPHLLEVWLRLMSAADVSPEMVEKMRSAYAKDVAILPPGITAAIIAAGGLNTPVPFFQSGLIHGWYTTRAAGHM